MTGIFILRENRGETETNRKNTTGQQRQRLEWCFYKPLNIRDSWQPLEARKRPGRIFPQNFQRERALSSPEF